MKRISSFVVYAALLSALFACEGETTEPNKLPQTLDEAISRYLQEIEPAKYPEGTHFVSSYTILDTNESSDGVTVFIYVLCEWIDSEGDAVSGRAGLTSLVFGKVNDTYKLEKNVDYIKPDEPEIPQKVRDAISAASYYDDMRMELDKDIGEILR